MLCHLRCQNLQERMSVRYMRSALEGLGGFLVVPKLHVIDEAQVVVEPPVVGIVLNAILHQLDGAIGLTSAVRRLRSKEAAAKLVCDHEMRIEMRGDFQKRRQQVVAGSVVVMTISEVL